MGHVNRVRGPRERINRVVGAGWQSILGTTPYCFSTRRTPCSAAPRPFGASVAPLPSSVVSAAIKRLSIDISFRSLLVFRPGSPLSINAQELLRVMRIQLDHDLKVIEAALDGNK